VEKDVETTNRTSHTDEEGKTSRPNSCHSCEFVVQRKVLVAAAGRAGISVVKKEEKRVHHRGTEATEKERKPSLPNDLRKESQKPQPGLRPEPGRVEKKMVERNMGRTRSVSFPWRSLRLGARHKEPHGLKAHPTAGRGWQGQDRQRSPCCFGWRSWRSSRFGAKNEGAGRNLGDLQKLS